MSSNLHMAGAMVRIRKESGKVFAAALFFSTGFCMILFADRLITRGTGIELTSFAGAVIGGLVVAKLLVLVDLLPFIQAFPHKPLVHNIVWKSSIYVAASLMYRYLEPLIRHLWQGLDLDSAHRSALAELLLPRTWATEIWFAMLLVVFVTMQEMARVLGKDKLRLMFIGR
jgi:hypothetical protein